MAGLGVQREELEVHGAGEGERHADAVEDVAVGEDAHVEVGLDDVVELAVLLVTEEGVRHPHLPVRSISSQPINQQLYNTYSIQHRLNLKIVSTHSILNISFLI